MDYVGEHLLPGQLGYFFSILSLLASLIATFAYFKNTRAIHEAEKVKWIKLARISFIAEVISVFAVFGILFYIIFNHYFEYKYAWQHSSLSLETKYLLASFWEGQEGSFLLWSIWHCLLGLILIRKAGSWEGPVMTVVSFAQFCLATMIIGASVFGAKIGASPFVLLRNEMDAPIFSRPDYLSLIKDGNDLNPLLQNYWMVIHPPVLFLGFAMAIIPFSYAVAGLWTKKYKEWIRPALPWALFTAAILATGIMMGAMWAYESLTFGGFWAWDPVENAVLVPWLILIAGIHTLLIFKHTSRALKTTFLFFLIAYLFILYSTFLTRSGILGDSSVHAFTDLGLNTQILLFLLGFILLSVVLFIRRYRQIPLPPCEQARSSSREFWMFIGSLVLFFSAISIIVMTSIPVYNKVAGLFEGTGKNIFKPLAIGEDSEYSYNRIQICVAFIVGFLTAIIQYLKYRHTGLREVVKKIIPPTLVALALSLILLLFEDFNYDKHGIGYMISIWLAIVSSIYAIIANLSYIRTGLRGKLKLAGGSITHFGFGLLLLGILVSTTKKQVLSQNSGALASLVQAEEQISGENLTLIKGVKTSMGKFWVTYKSDSVHPKKPLWFYNIQFESKDGKDNYTLTPNAFVNYKGNEGIMSNPAYRHYWNHDVFIYLTSLPDPRITDTTAFTQLLLKKGDSLEYSNNLLVLEQLVSRTNISAAGLEPGDTASIATIKVISKNGSLHSAQPILIKRQDQLYFVEDTVESNHLIVRLHNINEGGIILGLKKYVPKIEFVTMKVYKFPFINLIWIGTAIMFCGFVISSSRRLNDKRRRPLINQF